MFTGLIEEKGLVKGLVRGGKSGKLRIGCCKIIEGIKLGDSISVNGICLTVTNFDNNTFEVDFMPETGKVTNISSMSIGHRVNLERALLVGDRLGGHIVSGHVDGIGIITSFNVLENATEVKVRADSSLMKYIVKRGSIAIDGASLTVVDSTRETFVVSIIPHTKKETILLDKKAGDIVNLECDSIGKYIERFIEFRNVGNEKGMLTMELLGKNGFI